jgi:hypothetical protein
MCAEWYVHVAFVCVRAQILHCHNKDCVDVQYYTSYRQRHTSTMHAVVLSLTITTMPQLALHY